jgi:hypothetical protein
MPARQIAVLRCVRRAVSGQPRWRPNDYDLWLLAPYRRARLTPNLRATLSGGEPADVLTIARLCRAVGIALTALE